MHARPKSPLLSNKELSNIPHFYEAEDLGCAPPKPCNDCKMCPSCRLYKGNYHQTQVVKVVQTNTKLDKDEQRVGTTYPFNSLASSMKDNRSHALKVQQATKARIKKQGLTGQYNMEFQKYLSFLN